ncbi:TetR/AcrR family transcriptional regulator C-terminal domain-containing protein [Pseudonocardia sp. HH130630-07]|uniref:TetR/AcrR family transcriptional regulator C-terminal domain-containing protein n=1 Tax=Pseudonocardia sp. HH130630-07 TaxID=1690815 RepID=UPI0008150AF4|nr:TetR/AcrR family transcriptional regulator C-terminal domain-containing protein [Pseudonocardia sp. HH130630-07]ANY10666.1 hypothetical protein AFB00_30125 [Pseudonocardia sp. HH130630-07]
MARDTLDQSQIVTAAIDLLDRKGLTGLSMRRLGQGLGVSAPTLYWHVQDKDNLIELASDRVWRSIPLLDPAVVGWRQAATDLGMHTYHLGVAHHWLISATISAYAYGTGMARYQDHSYAIFETAGFSDAQLDWAVNTLFNFVLGAMYQDSARAAALAATPDTDKNRLLSVSEKAAKIMADFPRLQARAHAQAAPDAQVPPSTDPVVFGLAAVLDGLAAALKQDVQTSLRTV